MSTNYDVLETRFDRVPMSIMDEINQIDNVRMLEELHRNAVKTRSMQGFEKILKTALAPA